VLGWTRPGGERCEIESIDPANLKTRFYALPACGVDVAAGDGQIFLAANVFVRGTNDWQIHVEAFDTASRHATVLAPVVMTVVGSAIAHTALAFGDGSLWFYAYAHRQDNSPAAPAVVDISPSTGVDLATFTGVPEIGGQFPAAVSNTAGLWVASGPGGSPDLALYPSHSSSPTVVYAGSALHSILWLSAVGNLVWADIATYPEHGDSILTRLAAFDTTGKKVVESPPEVLGDDLPVVGSGTRLWSVGVGRSCSGPQRLLRVDTSTGQSTAILSLRTPLQACLDEGFGSQLAAVDGSVFVLDPTQENKPASVLYRVEN